MGHRASQEGKAMSYEAWGEPDDFDDQCPDCDDGTFSREEMVVDGIHYPAIVDQPCETCGGEGYIEYEPFEDHHYDD
jgi:hypothetical protein